MVAALWGVFIWKEFKDAPAGTGRLLAADVRLVRRRPRRSSSTPRRRLRDRSHERADHRRRQPEHGLRRAGGAAPAPGETVLGGGFAHHPGRQGREPGLRGRPAGRPRARWSAASGDDVFGEQLRESLAGGGRRHRGGARDRRRRRPASPSSSCRRAARTRSSSPPGPTAGSRPTTWTRALDARRGRLPAAAAGVAARDGRARRPCSGDTHGDDGDARSRAGAPPARRSARERRLPHPQRERGDGPARPDARARSLLAEAPEVARALRARGPRP